MTRREWHPWVVVPGVTVGCGALLAWAEAAFGLRSGWFALAVVWLPMTWLGTLSRWVRPRLPAQYHRLRRFERDGRIYELFGVRIVKALLRGGPMAAFNPGLHLPAERTPASIAQLDQKMRDAEASHAILFVAMMLVAAHAAARGWWAASGWTVLFDALANGYPTMLQRYNRALLAARFGACSADVVTHAA